MEIRQAFPNEVVAVMAVLSSAKQFLAESGSSQWQGENGYPNEDDVFDDILQGQAYVAVVGGQIVAYAAVIGGKDEALAFGAVRCVVVSVTRGAPRLSPQRGVLEDRDG